MSARLGFMNGFREQVERMEIRNKKDLLPIRHRTSLLNYCLLPVCSKREFISWDILLRVERNFAEPERVGDDGNGAEAHGGGSDNGA